MNIVGVAFIEPIGGHGGNDIYDINLVRSICEQKKYKAFLYTSDKTFSYGVETVRHVYKNIYGKKNKLFRLFNYIRGTFDALIDAKKNKVSIIHLHFYSFSVLEYFNLFVAKKIFNFKVVGTIHDVECFEKYAKGDNTQHEYGAFLFLLDGIVMHTDYARRELLKHIGYDAILGKKIKTIYACDLEYERLDKNKIEKKEARKYLGLSQGRKIVLFFGQIKKVKGLDVLLKGLAKVKKDKPSVLLVVAGKVWKDDFSEYKSIIKKFGLESYVELRIGYIDNENVPYYFYAADVIVLPYKKIYNSGVLIRAMSFGTPVLASNIGPFEEFIIDYKNGYLFKTEEVESLAHKLNLILNDCVSLEKVSKEEKAFIKRHFALEKIGEKYHEFYEDILKESS